MPYGQLNKQQSQSLANIVKGKVVHDLGAGDLTLATQILDLGATKVIAIDKEYSNSQPSDAPQNIEIRSQSFQNMDEDIDVAFISWPSNYDNGLIEVLKRSKQIVYLGKNTDGSACGTKDLFIYLATRKVEEHRPSRSNTLIHYTDELERPRWEFDITSDKIYFLLLEERAAIEMSADKDPVPYRNPKCQKLCCENECLDHPEMGMLCVCQEHYEMIQAGECRAPPIRRNIDYCSVGRKTLFYEDYVYGQSADLKPIPDITTSAAMLNRSINSVDIISAFLTETERFRKP